MIKLWHKLINVFEETIIVRRLNFMSKKQKGIPLILKNHNLLKHYNLSSK